MAANPFLATGHEVNCHEPFRDGDVRVFEDRPDPYRELFTADFALVDASPDRTRRPRLGRERVDCLTLAEGAHGTIRPAFRFQEFPRLRFVREDGCECR